MAQPSLENAVLQGVNKARRSAGLRPVQPTAILRGPARAHSKYLAVKLKGKLRHQDARGRPFNRRLVDAGWARNTRMSENLYSITACRPKDAQIGVRRWLASKSHRANMLDPKVTHVGIGVITTRGCRVSVYTADFGQLKKGTRLADGAAAWTPGRPLPVAERSERSADASKQETVWTDTPIARRRSTYAPPNPPPTNETPEPPDDTGKDEDTDKRAFLASARGATPRARLSSTRPRP